jgi:hypothetical protein
VQVVAVASAVHQVVARPAVHDLGARPTQQLVVAVLTEARISALDVGDHVVTLAAVDTVSSPARQDPVVPIPATDHVRALARDDVVVAGSGDHHLIAVALMGRDVLVVARAEHDCRLLAVAGRLRLGGRGRQANRD